MWFAGAVVAFASPPDPPSDPPSTVVDVLRIGTGRDGIWRPAEILDDRLRALCAADDDTACALVGRDLRDRSTLAGVLAPRCASGDGEACLGLAWTRIPPSPTGAFEGWPADRSGFADAVGLACDAGIPRGCTELGYAFDAGIVAYPDRATALGIWSSSCQAGDLRGCTALAEATGGDLVAAAPDDPLAMIRRADGAPGNEAIPWLREACDAGAYAACADLLARTGALSDPARDQAEAACAAGDAFACDVYGRLGLVDGTLTRDEGIAHLITACAASPAACEEAAFVEQGAPPVTHYTTASLRPPLPVQIERNLVPEGPELHQCLLDAIPRTSGAQGHVAVAMRLDGRGRVVGTHLPDPFDAAYADCVAAALRGAWIRTGATTPSRVTTTLSAFYGLEVQVGALGVDRGDALVRSAVAAQSRSWGEALDGCAIRQGALYGDLQLDLTLSVARRGTLKRIHLIEGTGIPEVDGCILDWIASRQIVRSDGIGVPLKLEIRPLQRVAVPIPAGDPPAVLRDYRLTDPGDPVVVDMLVLVAARGRSGDATATLSAAARTTIAARHELLADLIRTSTGGRVQIAWTLQPVDAEVETFLDQQLPQDRYRVVPMDLPHAVVASIPRGAFDSVVLWSPIPEGVAEPAIGTTYASLLGGATLSSLVVPEAWAPETLSLVRVWWEQNLLRAVPEDQHARTGWPPDPAAPLWADGRLFDPRPGRASSTAWYPAVFGAMPHAFWRDVWDRDPGIGVAPDNLALTATGIGRYVAGVSGLGDTRLGFRHYGVPRGIPLAVQPWFGLAWDREQTVSRIVAHTGRRDDPAVSSWTGVDVEVSTGDAAGPWEPIEATLSRDGAAVVLSFPPRTVGAVRLHPTFDDVAVCREIEVYAE